jgi:hypothetical protein
VYEDRLAAVFVAASQPDRTSPPER